MLDCDLMLNSGKFDLPKDFYGFVVGGQHNLPGASPGIRRSMSERMPDRALSCPSDLARN
jgi:hypothetical protein